jgi:hypothetical protein
MTKGLLSLLSASVLIASVSSCNKDDDAPQYTVPTTYTFDNVEYKESGARVSMWVGYTGILGRSNVRQLSQDTINNLWTNTKTSFTAETAAGIPYTHDVLNTLAFSLATKTTDAATFKTLADSMVKISQYYNTPASKGVAGKIGTRIFNYSGLEFNQAVAKGLMGALQLSNINSIFDKIATDDNNTVVPGSGTAMQHNWDLAFGYVGIPKDYDSGKAYTNAMPDRPFAVGGYFAERGKYIQAGGKVFEAFRKGRAAIVAKDYAGRDQAIATIREYIEKTIAAAAYYYITAAQTQAELSAKFHGLSEGYGFALALKYRAANSKLTAANYQALLDIMNTNFYTLAEDASNTKLKQAQAIFTTAYGQLQP